MPVISSMTSGKWPNLVCREELVIFIKAGAALKIRSNVAGRTFSIEWQPSHLGLLKVTETTPENETTATGRHLESVFPVVSLFPLGFCFCVLETRSLVVQAGLEFLMLLPPSVWLAWPHPSYFSEQLANEETRLLREGIYQAGMTQLDPPQQRQYRSSLAVTGVM